MFSLVRPLVRQTVRPPTRPPVKPGQQKPRPQSAPNHGRGPQTSSQQRTPGQQGRRQSLPSHGRGWQHAMASHTSTGQQQRPQTQSGSTRSSGWQHLAQTISRQQLPTLQQSQQAQQRELRVDSGNRVASAVKTIREIYSTMKPRLESHREYLKRDPERNTPYPQNALAPSEQVNQCLNDLVVTCSAEYTAAEAKQIQEELKDIADDLRDISNLSEGEMERVAQDYIFEVFKNGNGNMPAPLEVNASKSEKISRLQDIVHNIPKNVQLEHIPEEQRFAFPYLDNYDVMAENELRLLTDGKEVPNLTDKKITFVGAGFPLSAIMYHLHSGAKINLVDIDKDACERAEKFLDICHKAGILDRNDFSIIHGDASKIKYNPISSDADTTAKNQASNSQKVDTDVLVFAAALPSEVKAQALKNVSSEGVAVINRCTSETNNLLYPSTKISALRKRYNLEELNGRHYDVTRIMYPEYAYQNKVEDGHNKKQVPAIRTSEINQNTAQLVNIKEEKS